MPQLKLGLVTGKAGYFDPLTNTVISLGGSSVRTINYDANTDLSNIARAVLDNPPALVLFEGQFPQVYVDKYKNSFTNVFSEALTRAEAKKGTAVLGVSTGEAEPVEIKAQAVEVVEPEATLLDAVAGEVTVKEEDADQAPTDNADPSAKSTKGKKAAAAKE